MTPVRVAAASLALIGLALVGCGGSDDDPVATGPTATDGPAATTPTTAKDAPACGVTPADIQGVLPPTSGVTENSTPDPRRCNFTWDDGGARGIDVAFVPGGRSSVSVPAGYTSVAGYGDEAYTSTSAGRASAIAYVGNDLRAVDVSGPGVDAASLRDLALQILDRAVH